MYLYFYYFSIPMLLITNLMMLFMNSSFYMWMIMEINLMCFMSMLSIYKFLNSEIMMMYFLIQSINSYMFLISSMMINMNFMNNFMMMILFMALISKMGFPPFHLWYLKIMKHLNWMIFYLNSSLQKFIPLMILFFYLNNLIYKMLIFIIIMICITPMMSINSYCMKLIMSFSSMIQIKWNMILMIINEKIWMIYFLIYNSISFSLIYMFNYFNMNYSFELNNKNLYFLNFSINFMIFSLASIPPFTGFLNKWMFMNLMFNKMNLFFNFLLMIFSLLNLYYYIRMMIISSMIYSNSINMNFNKINFLNFKNFKLNLIIMYLIFFILMYELF